MFREALREIRLHPSRIIATLIAIMISVGFMVAANVSIDTEQNSLAKQTSITTSKADVVIAPTGEDDPKLVDTIKAMPGVKAAESLGSLGTGWATNGDHRITFEMFTPPGEDFNWTSMKEGTWPSGKGQIALSPQAAKKLGVKVGDSVELNSSESAKVVGITNDQGTVMSDRAYVQAADGSPSMSAIRVKLDDSSQASTWAEQAQAKHSDWKVSTASDYQADQLSQLMNEFDAFKYFLYVFVALALVVGMIIIANTFTILITQRRRQIGLLRAVGASGSQVRGRFLAEAALVGLIGSVMGVVFGFAMSAIGAMFTGSIGFGLATPWGWVIAALVVGTLITVVAAFFPILRTTQVAPLEALQPVMNPDAARRTSIVRAVFVGLFALAGIGLLVVSLTTKVPSTNGSAVATLVVLSAVGSCAMFTFAVLIGARFFVPPILRGIGVLIGKFGPTPRLAGLNSARNPQRTSATAVALMLAMGLIVALQVGTATVRATMDDMLQREYPIDLMVVAAPGHTVSANEKSRLEKAKAKAAEFKGISANGDSASSDGRYRTIGTVDLGQVLPGYQPPKDGELYVTDSGQDPKELAQPHEVPKADGKGTITVRLVPLKGLAYGVAVANDSTLAQIGGTPQTLGYFYQMDKGANLADLLTFVAPLANSGDFQVDGGAMHKAVTNQVLDVLLIVITALLGVAIVIALIGVANTLGLSVIERTRESALLRALGMQRSSLRWMLFIEAVLLSLVATVVGIIAGASFAWIVFHAVLGIASDTATVKFSVDPGQTALLLVVAVVAAGLASILPGRRAANAAPTEALNVE